ncbi:MAG: PVC-type heme-binding CxxCH protein [Limisphaerales bacterium]
MPLLRQMPSLHWLLACSALGWLPCALMPAAEFDLAPHHFTLPEGFTIEKVAATPLVNRPIVADLDDQGYLYVADSSGSNDKVTEQLKERPHRLVRLGDSDGDGIYDEQTVFADGLMFPEGVLWHRGAIYCSTPPEILRLVDTDSDGVADLREVWMDGQTLTGCANDLHGPYLGRDGWIYWAKGAFAEQEHRLFDGSVMRDRAAHIFRMLPDGREKDVLISGGMDNPVEVAFNDAGEAFFTTTFVSHPRSGQRDGLVHALYRGVYPKEHGVLDGLSLTGPYLGAMTHLGPAAPSGLMHAESGLLDTSFRGDLFSTQFNLKRIQRHELVAENGSFSTIDSDFLVSDHHDFHPTDILEDGDGSLLVLDTGGWYKLCCPTSQLYKPDILGAIYRVSSKVGAKPADPFGKQIDWKALHEVTLIDRLIDPRTHVSRRAMDELILRGDGVIPFLADRLSQDRVSLRLRQKVAWTLCQLHSPDAMTPLLGLLENPEAELACVALHALGLHRERRATKGILACLQHENPLVRRRACEAAGRIPVQEAIPDLLEIAPLMQARPLEHALVQALIQLDVDPETLLTCLKDAQRPPESRRVAMLALSQSKTPYATKDWLADLLFSSEPLLQETARWILGVDPSLGEGLLEILHAHLQAISDDHGQWSPAHALLLDTCNKMITQGAVQGFIGQWLQDDKLNPPGQRALLNCLAASQLRKAPSEWVGALNHLLSKDQLDPTIRRLCLSWMLESRVDLSSYPEMQAMLSKLQESSSLDEDTRLTLLALSLADHLPLSEQTMQWLLRVHKASNIPNARARVMDIWEASELEEEQLVQVLPIMSEANPLEFLRMVQWFHGAESLTLGQALLDLLERATASSTLRPDLLLHAVSSFPESIVDRARGWIQASQMDLEGQRRRLETLMGSLPAGDVRRGQTVFKAELFACSKCHQIGYVGGHAGPDLSRIGAVRQRLDLLESILYPSASFVRSYEPVQIELENGEQFSGIPHQELNNVVRVVTGANQEIRINQDQIHDMSPSSVSLMPSGLGDLLTQQQLADLLVFLESRK